MADEFLRVNEELRKESERGAVILAFAWMDDELTRVLKKFCAPSLHSSDKGDELFGTGRPIGDAATKIDLVFRLGLIQEHTHKSLHLVRKLRNDFAHLSSRLSFETNSVRDRIRTLFDLQSDMTDAILENTRDVPEIAIILGQHAGRPSPQALSRTFGARPLFHMIAGTMVAGLMLLTNDIPTVTTLLAPSRETTQENEN
jgi:hypothetical protein